MAGQRWQRVYGSHDAAVAAATWGDGSLPVREFLDRKAGHHGEVAVSFTVPSTSPYTVLLPRVLKQSDLSCTVGGVARGLVSGAPGAGEWSFDLASGIATFNAGDAGGAAVVTLGVGVDTVITGEFLAWLQAQVELVKGEAVKLVDVGTGLVVKTGTGPSVLAARAIAASGAGISVANGDGVAGNPTVSLSALLQGLAGLTPSDGGFVVGDGTGFGVETAGTARASLGLSPDARTIWVSAASGSDEDGDGSAGAPLATFGAAMTAAVALEAACVIVLGPGSYTWTSEWEEETPEQPMPTAPIGIVGAGRGLTTLTLAKVGDWGRHDCSLLQALTVTVGASTTARINRITGFDQVVRDCDFEATGSGSALQFVVVSGSAALVMAGCRFVDGGESYSATIDAGALVLGTEFLHEGNTTATAATVRDCEIAKPSGVVTLNSRSRLIGCRVEADRLAGSLLEMVGCRCLLGDMGIDVDPATSEPARITDNTILVTGDTAPAKTFLMLVENASTERCVIARNEIVYEGDFEESGSGGHVAVIGREEFAGVLEISGNVIETTTIGIMDSHPSNDSSRTTQVRPTTLVGNVIKCTLPAVDGPNDRKGAVVRYGGGAFFSQGNLFEMDSSANTATDFDHVAVWVNSTGLSGAYASTWTSMNDVFRITAASGSMDSGITKGVIRFDNTSNSPSAVAIRGALMDVKDTTTVVDCVGAAAPGAWFVGDWRLVSRSTGTTTQYVNAVAVGSWGTTGLRMGAGAQIFADAGTAANPGVKVGSAGGWYDAGSGVMALANNSGSNTVYVTAGGAIAVVFGSVGLSSADSGRPTAYYCRTTGAYHVGTVALLDANGFRPPSLADASAPNNCVYYSTTGSKLSYKDSGGTVHALH